MNKKNLLLLMCVSLLVCLFFGCSNKDTSKNGQAQQKNSSVEISEKGNTDHKMHNTDDDKAGDKTGKKADDKADDKTGNKADDKIGNKADDKTGNTTGDKIGKKVGDKTGNTTGKKVGDKAGNTTGKKADDKTDDKEIHDKYLNNQLKYKRFERDYKSIYDPVLARYHSLLSNPEKIDEIDDDMLGVLEELNVNAQSALSRFGYNIVDVSGDEVPELLIGKIDEERDGQHFGVSILALYTIVNQEPEFVFFSTSRDRHYYLGDGKFNNEGSAGGMNRFFAVYELSEDALELKYSDYYFTQEKYNDIRDIDYFHNKTGEPDPEKSEKLKISDEEFEAIISKINTQIKPIRWTLFYEYKEASNDAFAQSRIARILSHYISCKSILTREW